MFSAVFMYDGRRGTEEWDNDDDEGICIAVVVGAEERWKKEREEEEEEEGKMMGIADNRCIRYRSSRRR